MVKVKVSEATGATLNWLVAKCVPEGLAFSDATSTHPLLVRVGHAFGNHFSPTTDWAQGGPIIEREKIGIDYYSLHPIAPVWIAGMSNKEGPTPLIAAMRCLVSSKMGDEVEVPGELN